MVLITKHPAWSELAAEWSARNRNRTSHFNIYPTLLLAIGYERKAVLESYGPSLFDPTADPLTFISQFDRFGRSPRWTRIRLPVDRGNDADGDGSAP